MNDGKFINYEVLDESKIPFQKNKVTSPEKEYVKSACLPFTNYHSLTK